MVETYPIPNPVDHKQFLTLWATLLTGGIIFTCFFFVYQGSTEVAKRTLFWEISFAALASIFNGLGMIILLLWAGVWI